MPGQESDELPVAVGAVVDGKYLIERVLGRGGMGFVVAAYHLQLEEPVALKFLLPQALEDPARVARFQREARAAAKIKGEHVCRVHDVGEAPGLGPYMVMDILQGEDLHTRLRRQGPLPVPEAVDYVLQACEALAEAHARGIVHRDLKPANLFLTQRLDGSPLVKVVDFGLSKVLPGSSGADNLSLTSSAVVMGSMAYMSPEQARSVRTVDHRTDIWALGITLYELLTGSRPFQGESASAVLLNIAMEAPVAIRRLRSDVPPELEGILLRCLEKPPERRYQNVRDLAWALTPFTPGAASQVERIRRVSASLDPNSQIEERDPSTARGWTSPAAAEAVAVAPPSAMAGHPSIAARSVQPNSSAIGAATVPSALSPFLPASPAAQPPASGVTSAGERNDVGTSTSAPWTPGGALPAVADSSRKAAWITLVVTGVVVLGAGGGFWAWRAHGGTPGSDAAGGPAIPTAAESASPGPSAASAPSAPSATAAAVGSATGGDAGPSSSPTDAPSAPAGATGTAAPGAPPTALAKAPVGVSSARPRATTTGGNTADPFGHR